MVGDDNVIRENCTMSIGTIQDQGLTTVGSRNLFMANAHVAHDCQVGSDVILANNVALGGHVIVGDHAILGGQSAAHQFVRIGAFAMVGGAAGVLQDVPPFVMAHLNPAKARDSILWDCAARDLPMNSSVRCARPMDISIVNSLR